MARPKKSDVKKDDTKKVETKENEEMIALKEENKQLKNDMFELKNMLSSLIEESKNKKEEVKEDEDKYYNRNRIQIDPRELIPVTSLYHGGLNLTGLNNKSIRFTKFGQRKSIYFEDLENICSNNRGLVEKGMFFIHDDRVIEVLYLEEEYRKIIEFDKLRNIFKLSNDEIENLYKNTTKDLQKTIIHTFAKWVNTNDPFYIDKNKIEVINKVSGEDILKIAETIKQYDK